MTRQYPITKRASKNEAQYDLYSRQPRNQQNNAQTEPEQNSHNCWEEKAEPTVFLRLLACQMQFIHILYISLDFLSGIWSLHMRLLQNQQPWPGASGLHPGASGLQQGLTCLELKRFRIKEKSESVPDSLFCAISNCFETFLKQFAIWNNC